MGKLVAKIAVLMGLLVLLDGVTEFARAADAGIPYMADPDKRRMVGEAYAFRGGSAIVVKEASGAVRLIADTFIVYLIRDDLPEIWEGSRIVPHLVEIRDPSNEPLYTRRPLRWIFWSSKGDGVADWKARVIEYQNGDPEKPVFGKPERTAVDLRKLIDLEADLWPLLKEVLGTEKVRYPRSWKLQEDVRCQYRRLLDVSYYFIWWAQSRC